MKLKSAEYKFPTECCKCTLHKATDWHIVEKSISYVGEGAYIREKHFRASVPVCKDCADKMLISEDKLSQIDKKVLLVCIVVLTLVFTVIFPIWDPFEDVGAFLGALAISCVIGLAGGVILWKLIIFLLKILFPNTYDYYSVGIFDADGVIHFKNKAYDAKFRELNNFPREMSVKQVFILLFGLFGGVMLLIVLFMYLLPD